MKQRKSPFLDLDFKYCINSLHSKIFFDKQSYTNLHIVKQQANEGKPNPSSEGGQATEDPEDLVPEELFRRYTETDSRPITPTPTLASVMTRIPRGRRCVTPDPPPVMPTQERTLLVLDLRRSHSQETLSCHAVSDPESLLIQFAAASSQF